MNSVQELLRRSAEAGVVRLSVDEVRVRVGRRRRVRYAGAAVCLAFGLAGAAALVSLNGGEGRVDVANGQSDLTLDRRWTALYSNAVATSPDGAFVELRQDGSFIGYDGCSPFHGRWSTQGDRLVVRDLSHPDEGCPEEGSVGLVGLLRSSPTFGTLGGANGTLRLEGPSGFIAFQPASPSKAEGIIQSDIVGEVTSGGAVTTTFRTPRVLTVGRDRMVARWSYVSEADTPVSIWGGFAIDGLPSTCRIEDVTRWEDLGPELSVNEWPVYPQANLPPGEEGVTLTWRRDVPEMCRGDYTLVLVTISRAFVEPLMIQRVPITIE